MTKSITSSDNLINQRRFAPMVIDCPEIVDRFQMKTLIAFVKLRIGEGTPPAALIDYRQAVPAAFRSHHRAYSPRRSSPLCRFAAQLPSAKPRGKG